MRFSAVWGVWLALAGAVGSVAGVHSARAGDFVLLGDAGNWTPHTQVVFDSVVRSGLRKLVMPGDNLYETDSSYEEVWAPWQNKGFEFTAVALGNHHAAIEREIRFFGMPGAYYSKLLEPGVRLIVLDSEQENTGSEQAAWFDREMQAVSEPVVLVMYHHPSLSVTDDHEWKDRKKFQVRIRPLLFQYRAKITAVLNGHDHMASLITFNDLPIVVAGASMQAREPSPRRDVQEGIEVRSRWLFEQAPYWVALRTDAATGSASVRFIRAKDDFVACEARLVTGEAPKLAPGCARTGTRVD